MTDDDLVRFTTAADEFLEACNQGQAAKEAASPKLINTLADLYPRYNQKAWHYQGCLFFVQPSDPDSRGSVRWRLAAR